MVNGKWLYAGGHCVGQAMMSMQYSILIGAGPRPLFRVEHDRVRSACAEKTFGAADQ
jgi:hypothetical protein